MTDTPAASAAPAISNSLQTNPTANTTSKTPTVEASSTGEPITIGKDGLVPLKINGVEKRVTLQEAITLAQKADAADQRFKLAANIERKTQQQTKAMQQFINELKTNPKKVLADPKLGLDLRKFAEQYLGEQIKYEMEQAALTPEQKEMNKLKAQLAEYEKEKEAKLLSEREAIKKQEADKMVAQITTEINEALTKANIHRDQKYAIGRMAYYMDYAKRQNIPLTWDQAAVQVKKDVTEGLRDYGKAFADDAELAESLGDDLIKRLNQYMINKAKGKAFGGGGKTSVNQGVTRPQKKSNKMTADQFKEHLNEKFGTNLT